MTALLDHTGPDPLDAVGPAGGPDPGQPSRPRRWMLGAVGSVAAAGAVSLAAAGPAEALEAGGRSRTRRVTKFVAVTWSYNKRTGRTTVTKARKKRVTARFVGKKVFERNGKGKWVRVPYRWSKKRKALVYDRRLHLRLMPTLPPKGRGGGPKPKPSPGGPLKLPAKASAASPYVSDSMAWHVARRASYGASAALAAEINSTGPAAWLEKQLHPASIPDTACDAYLRRFGKAGTGVLPLGLPIRIVNYALEEGTYNGAEVSRWQQQYVASQAHVVRALWSKRHLLTVMEDFWANHFNVAADHDDVEHSREHYQSMIRARALGRFSDLLLGVITHPAMLTYLNNRESDKTHPNENLGRELLELHTVGVDAPYGEAGVVNSARILTGLSVSSDSEEFMYKDWLHWTGRVKVLGFSDANASAAGGLDVAKRYLAYLAKHSSTATHVCRKLALHFVSDNPSPALVSKLAGVYLGTGTDISAVLRTLFSHPEFAASAGAKIHRPFERVAATVRALGYGPSPEVHDEDIDILYTPSALFRRADDAGNAPFFRPSPDGYPDVTGAWLSTAATLVSWNNRLGVTAGWWPGTQMTADGKTAVDPYSGMNLRMYLWPTTLPARHDLLVQAAATKLFGRQLASAHLAAVLAFLQVSATTAVSESSAAVTWKLEYWITLLLDSPYGLAR